MPFLLPLIIKILNNPQICDDMYKGVSSSVNIEPGWWW
jgi:hypothetical protein